MHVRFLSDGSEYRSYGGGNFSRKKEGGGIFWWAILITLLMGAATFCWFFSIMVFAHPEKPFNYKILAKFNKLDPLRPYTSYTVPTGKFLTARDMLTEFFPYSSEQIAVRNDVLKRSYIRNHNHEQPTYIKGSFQILSIRRLTPSDVVMKGWIVRARASDLEDVDVEIIMPGLTVETEPFTVGESISLDQRQCASALHVQRMDADRICVTVVPLAYTGFVSKNAGTLVLTPPDRLNLDAYWPITRDAAGSPNESGQQVAVKS